MRDERKGEYADNDGRTSWRIERRATGKGREEGLELASTVDIADARARPLTLICQEYLHSILYKLAGRVVKVSLA